MNRPNIQNYEIASGDTYSTKFAWSLYRKDLEKYCDELEKNKDKQFNAGFNEATNICSEHIIALEEALDKACEELDMLTQEFVPASNYPHITEEDELDRIDQWKKWCMEYEETK